MESLGLRWRVREFAQSYFTSNETKQQMVMQFQRKSTLPSKKRRGAGLDFLILGDFLRVRAFSVKKTYSPPAQVCYSRSLSCACHRYMNVIGQTLLSKKRKKKKLYLTTKPFDTAFFLVEAFILVVFVV
jgi:hypothetical protein